MLDHASQTHGDSLTTEKINSVPNCFCDLQKALEMLASTSSPETAATLNLISGQIQLAEDFYDQLQVRAAGSDRSTTAVTDKIPDDEIITQGTLNQVLKEFLPEMLEKKVQAINEELVAQAVRYGVEYIQNSSLIDRQHEDACNENFRNERLTQTANATTQTLGGKLYKRDFMTSQQLEHQKLINSNAQLVKEVKALRSLQNRK